MPPFDRWPPMTWLRQTARSVQLELAVMNASDESAPLCRGCTGEPARARAVLGVQYENRAVADLADLDTVTATAVCTAEASLPPGYGVAVPFHRSDAVLRPTTTRAERHVRTFRLARADSLSTALSWDIARRYI